MAPPELSADTIPECCASSPPQEPYSMPRLGGRRPSIPDFLAWSFAFVCAVPFLAIWSPVASLHINNFVLLWVAAVLLLPIWSLCRWDRFSRRISGASIRSDAYLAGLDARKFLYQQLKGDAIAAFGPQLLICTVAVLMLASYEISVLTSGPATHTKVPILLAYVATTMTFFTAAGSFWVFTIRCNRRSSGFGSYATVLVYVGAVLMTFLFLIWMDAHVRFMLLLQALTASLFVIAAMQPHVRGVIRSQPDEVRGKRSSLDLDGLAAVAIIAVFFAILEKLASSGVRIPLTPVHMGLLTAAAAAFLVTKRVIYYEWSWPGLAIGAVAMAGSTLLASRGMVIPLVLTPVGMLLLWRRTRSCKVISATIAGLLFGISFVWMRTRPDAWERILPSILFLLCAALFVMLARREARRKSEPLPKVTALATGLVLMLVAYDHLWIPRQWQYFSYLVVPPVIAAALAGGAYERAISYYYRDL